MRDPPATFSCRRRPAAVAGSAPGALRGLSAAAPASLDRLDPLTPGDFALVARKSAILGERSAFRAHPEGGLRSGRPCDRRPVHKGVYAPNSNAGAIAVMLAFGIVGFVLRRLGYPIACLIIGPVLAPSPSPACARG